MSGLLTPGLPLMTVPTLTFVTLKFFVATSIRPPSMPAFKSDRLPPPERRPDAPVTMFVACDREFVCSVTLPALTVPSMRMSPPMPPKPIAPDPCCPMNTPRSALMTAPAIS